MTFSALLLALVVGTWNGNWFPSGRAEHRAHPDVERATCAAAGRMLAEGLKTVDPLGTNDIILVLNEIRGPRAASNLVAAIGRPGLRVASVSGYRRRDRFDQQQDVIATTLPVAAIGWSTWKKHGRETPPRGYARAEIVLSLSVTTVVYAVHLKSNYGATKAEDRELNRLKRGHAIAQLVTQEKKTPCLIVAGDFNADADRREFASETIFPALSSIGCSDALSLLPPGKRGTHPNRRYGDSALDHIFCRGLNPHGLPSVIQNEGLSDHNAVFAVYSLPSFRRVCVDENDHRTARFRDLFRDLPLLVLGGTRLSRPR